MNDAPPPPEPKSTEPLGDGDIGNLEGQSFNHPTQPGRTASIVEGDVKFEYTPTPDSTKPSAGSGVHHGHGKGPGRSDHGGGHGPGDKGDKGDGNKGDGKGGKGHEKGHDKGREKGHATPTDKGGKGHDKGHAGKGHDKGDAQAGPHRPPESKAAQPQPNRSVEPKASLPPPNRSEAPPATQPEAHPATQPEADQSKVGDTAPASPEAGAAKAGAMAGESVEEGIDSFIEGMVLGDFAENPTVSAFVGQLVLGFTPLGPVGDVRDAVKATGDVIDGKDGAWTNLVIAGIGFVPFGDIAKGIGRAGRAAAKEGGHVAGELAQAGGRAVKEADEAAGAAAHAGSPGKGTAADSHGVGGHGHGDGHGDDDRARDILEEFTSPHSDARKGRDGVHRQQDRGGERPRPAFPKLGDALKQAGDFPPGPGYDAHHIIPENIKGLDDIRAAANKALGTSGVSKTGHRGYGLNSAANGVWLPKTNNVANAEARMIHMNQIHSGPEGHRIYAAKIRELFTDPKTGRVLQGSAFREKLAGLKASMMQGTVRLGDYKFDIELSEGWKP